MSDTFHLLDLPSQALAVQRLLSGRTEDEKLAWLSAHGRLVPIEPRISGGRPLYMFESLLGLRCVFFIAGDQFVFFCDHTYYTVKPIELGGQRTSTERDANVVARSPKELLDGTTHRRRNWLLLILVAGLAAWTIRRGAPTMTPVERALVGEWGRAETDPRLSFVKAAGGPLMNPWILQELASDGSYRQWIVSADDTSNHFLQVEGRWRVIDGAIRFEDHPSSVRRVARDAGNRIASWTGLPVASPTSGVGRGRDLPFRLVGTSDLVLDFPNQDRPARLDTIAWFVSGSTSPLASASPAQISLSARRRIPMSSELLDLNEQWNQAWFKKDAETVERLMADDYVYVAPNGMILDRQAILEIIRSPGYRIDHGSHTDVFIRAIGPEAAIVRRRWKGAGSLNGNSFTDDHRCVMVCEKVAGEWRVLFEQCSYSSKS